MVPTLAAVAGLTAIELRLYESPLSHDPITVATSLTVIGLIAYSRYFLRLRWLTATNVYLVLFWMFHFGLTFTVVLFPGVLLKFEDFEIDWLVWPNVRVGMLLGLIGAAGFVLGAGFFARGPVTEAVPATDRDRGIYVGGWLIMLVGTIASIVFVALNVGLAAIYAEGYPRFLQLSSTTMLGTLLGLANLGCLFAVCGAQGREWIKPMAVWGVCMALPVLILGARSGPMISLVGFAVVLSYGGVRLNRALLAGAVLVSMIAIPAIESFRNVGFANRSGVDWTDVAPVDTLTELGGSLRATMSYVDWIERGDSYLFGATYWAPFDRQILTRLIPGREPIPVEDDERLPGRLMAEREGPFGASATGEAYYNFGAVGPFLVLTVLGALFGWLERAAPTSVSGRVSMGAVMFALFFHIRGDWLAVPATIGEGLALMVCCQMVGRFVLLRRGQQVGHSSAQAVANG